MRNLSMLVMVLALLGCASGPKFAEVSSSIPKIADGKARLYFYRASAFGGAYQPDVKVNQNRVGSAAPNGVFYRDMAPGNYQITTTMDQGTQVSLALSAGEEKFIRLSYRIGFKVYPELVDNSTGKQEIQDLAYIQQP
jgi:hypothetical protein